MRARTLVVVAVASLVAGTAVWADVAAGGLLSRLDPPLHRAGVRVRAPGLVAVARVVTDTGGAPGRAAVAGAVVVGVLGAGRRAAARGRVGAAHPGRAAPARTGPAGTGPARTAPPPPASALTAVLTAALAPVLALAAAPAASASLKRLVGRARPPLADALDVQLDPSFPSGHATGSAALAVALVGVVIASGAVTSRGARAAVVAAGAAWVLAVGATRVLLGAHWPTDVLAGWCLGAAIGSLALCVDRLVRGRGGP